MGNGLPVFVVAFEQPRPSRNAPLILVRVFFVARVFSHARGIATHRRMPLALRLRDGEGVVCSDVPVAK